VTILNSARRKYLTDRDYSRVCKRCNRVFIGSKHSEICLKCYKPNYQEQKRILTKHNANCKI